MCFLIGENPQQTEWLDKRVEKKLYCPSFARVPYSLTQFSAAPWANKLCCISPHLLCGLGHKNTFDTVRCVPPCASPTGSFFFPAFPRLLCTAHSGLLKASMLPCTPKERNRPTSYCPGLNLTQELHHVHYPYIPWIRSSPSSSTTSDTVYYRRAVENYPHFLKRCCHPFSSVRKRNVAFFLTAFL